MSRAWGQALAALGSGLAGLAGSVGRREQEEQEEASQLALRGYFRREPKPVLSVGAGTVESVTSMPPSDPMLDAVAAGGGGRTLVPGMRPQPMSQTLGMDTPAAVAPAPAVRDPERLEALKVAIHGVAPKDYADNVEIGGETYEYAPERTPEGRRAAMQAALRSSADTAAYRAYRSSGGTEAYEAAAGNWADINQSRIGQAVRSQPAPIDQDRNRLFYQQAVPESLRSQFPYVADHDYERDASSALTAERGQQNRTEFRVMFPPNAGGGGGDGMTPTQQATQRRREAAGRAQTLAAEAYARGSRLPSGARNDVVGYVRHYLRQEFPDIPEAELQGIAATQSRVNRPQGGGGGSKSYRTGSGPLFWP